MSDIGGAFTNLFVNKLFGGGDDKSSGPATPLTGAMKKSDDSAAASAATQTDEDKRKKGLASLRFMGADKTGFASNTNTARAFLLAN